MKKIIIVISILLCVITIQNVEAKTINASDVSPSTYIIGKYMYTRNISSSTGYNGKLTTERIMLGARTILGNNLDDMTIYYKTGSGDWIDALTGKKINVPNTFEIETTDLVGKGTVIKPDLTSFEQESSEIGNSTYVIGNYVFTRNPNEASNYDGVLTTKEIMLAAKTITGDDESDMTIYYKTARGTWINALSGEIIEPPKKYEVAVVDLVKQDKTVSTLTLAKTSIDLTYGVNGENTYTYDGDGTISCESFDTTKVTCSVDKANHIITLVPIGVTSGVNVTINATEGEYYLATSKVINVKVLGANLSGNVKITGTNTWDSTLTAEVTNTNSATLSYQWYASTNESTSNGTAITGATSGTYKVSSDYVGKYIYVVISAGKENYENTTWNDITDTTNNVTAKVAKQDVCDAPSDINISTSGIVTWENSSTASGYQISIDNFTFTDATSGVDYKNVITSSAGSRTVYVRSKCNTAIYNNAVSSSVSKSTTVYSVTLTKGDSVETVSGEGNYITGSTVRLDATVITDYAFLKWTQTNGGELVSNEKNYSAIIDSSTGNWEYTANATALPQFTISGEDKTVISLANSTCGITAPKATVTYTVEKNNINEEYKNIEYKIDRYKLNSIQSAGTYKETLASNRLVITETLPSGKYRLYVRVTNFDDKQTIKYKDFDISYFINISYSDNDYNGLDSTYDEMDPKLFEVVADQQYDYLGNKYSENRPLPLYKLAYSERLEIRWHLAELEYSDNIRILGSTTVNQLCTYGIEGLMAIPVAVPSDWTAYCAKPTYNGGTQSLTSNPPTDVFFLNKDKVDAGTYTVTAHIDAPYYIWSDNWTFDDRTFSCTMLKRYTTCTSNSDSKTYDATALTKGGGTCTNLVSGHSPTFTNTGSITNVGTTQNTISSVVIKSGNTDVSSNYNITKSTGTLTVNKRPTTCTSNSDSKTYDATALTKGGGSCTNLVSGHTPTFTNTGSITNVGSTPNTISNITINSGGLNVTNNYNITRLTGTLTVYPKNIGACPGSPSNKTYTGGSISSGVSCPQGATASGTTSATNTGNYIQTCTGTGNYTGSCSILWNIVTSCGAGYYLPTNSQICTSCSSNITNGYYCPGVSDVISSTSNQGLTPCPTSYNSSDNGRTTISNCYRTSSTDVCEGHYKTVNSQVTWVPAEWMGGTFYGDSTHGDANYTYTGVKCLESIFVAGNGPNGNGLTCMPYTHNNCYGTNWATRSGTGYSNCDCREEVETTTVSCKQYYGSSDCVPIN